MQRSPRYLEQGAQCALNQSRTYWCSLQTLDKDFSSKKSGSAVISISVLFAWFSLDAPVVGSGSRRTSFPAKTAPATHEKCHSLLHSARLTSPPFFAKSWVENS